MGIAKISFIIAIIISFFWFCVFGVFYSDIKFHLYMLFVLLVLNLILKGLKNTLSLVRDFLPMLIPFYLVGLLLQYNSSMGRTDWINDTYIKMLLFPNSVILINLCFSLIKPKDIFRIPIPTYYRAILLVLFSVYEKGFNVSNHIKFYLKSYSYLYKSEKKRNNPRKRKWLNFNVLTSILLSLYNHVKMEYSNHWDIIENRYKHLKYISDEKT